MVKEQKEDLKVGHILERDGTQHIAFSKACVTSLPPTLFFPSGVACKVLRTTTKGLEEITPRAKGLRRDGLDGAKLKPHDRVEILGTVKFYEQLYTFALEEPGRLIWIDPDLKAALEARRIPDPAAVASANAVPSPVAVAAA